MRALFPGVSMAVATAMASDTPTPRCMASRITRYLNDTKPINQCEHSARFEHAGRFLCTRHASAVALAELLKQSKATHDDHDKDQPHADCARTEGQEQTELEQRGHAPSP